MRRPLRNRPRVRDAPICVNRLRRDPRTRRYVAKRTAEGKSKRETMRCLKRYIARETYHALLMARPGESDGTA